MSIYAFIDSQNLNLAIKKQGWKLDFQRYRKYLRDKYKIRKAFLFIGYLEENKKLYKYLKKSGFILIFKPVMKLAEGKVKGNVDTELVLHTMIQYKNFDEAIIVSNDGDFYCLVEYLLKKRKLFKLMIPDRDRYSSLLKTFRPYIVFMNLLKKKLEYNEKRGSNLRTEP